MKDGYSCAGPLDGLGWDVGGAGDNDDGFAPRHRLRLRPDGSPTENDNIGDSPQGSNQIPIGAPTEIITGS
jgi:hypothetical protein